MLLLLGMCQVPGPTLFYPGVLSGNFLGMRKVHKQNMQLAPCDVTEGTTTPKPLQ